LVLHESGKASAYTRSRRPLILAHQEILPDRRAALKREAAIRKLRRSQKLALCSGAI
jgi:predicted GIY-YIG superfamily endonuclease